MKTRTRLALVALAGLAMGGCASADKNADSNAAGQNAADTTPATAGSGGTASAGSVVSSGASMPGMNMHTTTVIEHGVPTPVPVKTIASGDWKAMRILAQETTPVPFYVDNGTSSSESKPGPRTSFHLMVMLSDRQTGQALPYAQVWATISKNGRTIFNERQWPMLSRFMGPHYGNNVTLPGPGTYKLTLLVSAPAAAEHVEYANMWQGRHEISSTFTWPDRTG